MWENCRYLGISSRVYVTRFRYPSLSYKVLFLSQGLFTHAPFSRNETPALVECLHISVPSSSLPIHMVTVSRFLGLLYFVVISKYLRQVQWGKSTSKLCAPVTLLRFLCGLSVFLIVCRSYLRPHKAFLSLSLHILLIKSCETE
jgi:hypothetical protein